MNQFNFIPKDPIKYDDQWLKQQSCRHDNQKMHEDGNVYCETCHLSEADVERSIYDR